jgi:carbamoyltransferase
MNTNIKTTNCILGINVSHNASACLMHNNEIIICIQEERLTNKKSFFGYPKKSIDYCLSFAKKNKIKIDEANFTTNKLPIFSIKFPVMHFFSINDFLGYFGEDYYGKKLFGKSVKDYLNNLSKDKRNNQNLYLSFNKIKPKDYFDFSKSRMLQKDYFIKQSKNKIKKINFLDHHSCHAAYAFYSSKKRLRKSAIITIDSEGDGLNQTVWIVDKNLKLQKVSESKTCDIARIYKLTTLSLKMKPDEHEYKVMGMAPYAKNNYSLELYERVYKNLLQVKGIKIVHKNRPRDLFKYIQQSTKADRFDNIAGGVQIFVEELIKKLLSNIYKKYKIQNFYLSGGVSMNIKMNKVLTELPFVKNLIVQPSGGDESLSMGGCYLKTQEISKPISNIYLGRDLFDNFSEEKFLEYVKKSRHLKIYKNFSSLKAAKLIAQGNVLAIARGREEFGARALGNRSIVADPSNVDMVQKINESIKNRDFWMPFALSILKNYAHKFFINKKKIESDYMTIGFDCSNIHYKKIIAGTHRYDKTVRPQMLDQKSNKKYFALIKNFYKIKKIPALLNTSLNLHGFPLASTIKEVLYTFEKSDLQYLYVNDYYLVQKK